MAKKRKPREPWSAEDTQYLGAHGSLSDAQIAKRLGRSVDAVRRKRWLMRLPKDAAAITGGTRERWSANDVQFLCAHGALDDAQIAKRLGRSVDAVRKKRSMLTLPLKTRDWESEELATLKRMAKDGATDQEVAKALGRAVNAVRQKRQLLKIRRR